MSTAITLHDAHTKFIDYLKEKKRASATILAYGKDIDQLVEYLQNTKNIKNAHEVTKEHISDFMQKLLTEGYTPKSISRKTNSTKTFFRFLKVNNFVDDDPAALVAHPKYDAKPPRILSKLEYRALRDACRDDVRIASIVELLLQTGIRIGELANLTIEDLRGDKLFIKGIEGHETREVPLNKAAQNLLKKYIEVRPQTKEPTLFVTKTGKPLLVRNIRTAIDRYFKIAGIKEAKVNDLRHTFIAHHLMSGASLVLVSKLVGHKRLSTTEKYLELIKDKIEENAKLGEL